ncbi:MAG: chemotaxis protein CheW [Micavibrio sp.]|nr:chemotaxis protein CheW [Micavibrio sp.]
MPFDLDDEVREFLIECNESLVHLDQEIVQLEQTPDNATLLASVFRTFHTIKGTCGFFGFSVLGGLTHVAENILDQMRSGSRTLTAEVSALLLETVDAIKAIMASIETQGTESDNDYSNLRARLAAVLESSSAAAPSRAVLPAEPPTAPSPAPQSSIPSPSDPPPSTEELQTPKSSGFIESTIRVDVGLLDKLMNLVGELVLARNQLLQGATGHDSSLIRTIQRLNAITSELQEGVLKTRMQPIGVVWNKLPRIVRDLATECGKKIRIEMEGAETELDKTIIEAIKDPLTHIVRNSCDHGIEAPQDRLSSGKISEGTVTLRAYHEGGHVNIEISDDGRGLNPERLKARAVEKGLITEAQAATLSTREAIHLVFAPGFSTANTITTISGRGVGMDVVKTNIQKIGGIVDITNNPQGAGSVVKITIPLTLAIIPGLVIRAVTKDDEHRFVIPQANLLELVRIDRSEARNGMAPAIEYVNGAPVYRRRGQLLPLTYLNRVLGLQPEIFPSSSVINIVVLQAEGRPFGLVVDGISDTQEIVVKPLGKRLKNLSSYLGATIMGDGHVALILDIPGLATLAGMAAQSRELRKDDLRTGNGEPRQSFLLFRAGRFERVAVPLHLVSRLEQIDSSSVRYAAGKPVLHYRGEILPLLELGSFFEQSSTTVLVSPGTNLQVIVLGNNERRLGVVVDQILDVVEESVSYKRPAQHTGLSSSIILGNTITDLLDAETLLAPIPHNDSPLLERTA